MSKVLGLDMSLTSTGLALARDGKLVRTANVKTAGKRDDSLSDRHRRLRKIEAHVVQFMQWDWQSLDLAVIEAPSFGSVGGSSHDRSGLWWMVVDLMLGQWDIPVVAVAPKTRAKYITGSGNADKSDVLKAARDQYDSEPWVIENHDQADAAGLAAMGARYLGEPLEDEITAAQEAAFKVVKAWPPMLDAA